MPTELVTSAVPALPKALSQRSSLCDQFFKVARARYLHRRETENLSNDRFNDLARHLDNIGVTTAHAVHDLSRDDIRSLVKSTPQLHGLFLCHELDALLSSNSHTIDALESRSMSHVFFALKRVACLSRPDFLSRTAQMVNFNQLSVLLSSYDASGTRNLTEYVCR